MNAARKVEPRCFQCGLLEVRRLESGRPTYWCVIKKTAVSSAYIWRRACEDFTATGPSDSN